MENELKGVYSAKNEKTGEEVIGSVYFINQIAPYKLQAWIKNGNTHTPVDYSSIRFKSDETETDDASNVDNQVEQITLTNNGEQTKMTLTLSNGEETEDKIVVRKYSNVSNVDSEEVPSFEDVVDSMFMFCDPVVNENKLYISAEKAREFLLEWQKKQLQK